MQKQSDLLVNPKAVSAKSTAARYGERGLEGVPDLADLGLAVCGKSGKSCSLVLIGGTLGIPCTTQHQSISTLHIHMIMTYIDDQ